MVSLSNQKVVAPVCTRSALWFDKPTMRPLRSFCRAAAVLSPRIKSEGKGRAAALSVVLMSAVIFIGSTRQVEPTQMIATFSASVLLGLGALGIGLGGLFTKVRWNNSVLEHRSAFGRETKLAWSDVRSVRPHWRGITIATHDAQRVTFSQFHSGAAQLAIHATNRARRNSETSTKAFAGL